jgi:hypothetical protein
MTMITLGRLAANPAAIQKKQAARQMIDLWGIIIVMLAGNLRVPIKF